MVLGNRKYHWSGWDAGRIMRRSDRRAVPARDGRNALDSKVVAEGEGPAGEAEVAIFAFFRGLRRPEGAEEDGDWLARCSLGPEVSLPTFGPTGRFPALS